MMIWIEDSDLNDLRYSTRTSWLAFSRSETFAEE